MLPIKNLGDVLPPSAAISIKRRARGSNPQPVARHLISNQAANHSLTLRIIGRSGPALSHRSAVENGTVANICRLTARPLGSATGWCASSFIYCLTPPGSSGSPRIVRSVPFFRPYFRPLFPGSGHACREGGPQRLCGSAGAPFQRLCRAHRPTKTGCGGHAAWICYAGSHECVSCRSSPNFHTQSPAPRPIPYCGGREFLDGGVDRATGQPEHELGHVR